MSSSSCDTRRLSGTFERFYDLPPGGVCDVDVGLTPRLATDAPAERGGELTGWSRWSEEPGDDRAAIVARADDGAGTTTWTLDDRRAVRAGPAPPGVGPPELDTLVVEAYVEAETLRYGTPDRDGYPVLRETPAQRRRCAQLTERAFATVLPRALTEARLVPRRRPPRADPDDEGPTPVDREY